MCNSLIINTQPPLIPVFDSTYFYSIYFEKVLFCESIQIMKQLSTAVVRGWTPGQGENSLGVFPYPQSISPPLRFEDCHPAVSWYHHIVLGKQYCSSSNYAKHCFILWLLFSHTHRAVLVCECAWIYQYYQYWCLKISSSFLCDKEQTLCQHGDDGNCITST